MPGGLKLETRPVLFAKTAKKKGLVVRNPTGAKAVFSRKITSGGLKFNR
jgi:hypothetical protein